MNKLKNETVSMRPIESRPSKEEKASVLEIIADLETQLEAAFSIKNEQAIEIERLEKELQKAGQKIAIGDVRSKELQELSASQEKLNAYLEYLENERLTALEKIKALEVQLSVADREKEEFTKKLDGSSKDLKSIESRLDQMESELNNAHQVSQNFQKRIQILQQEKEDYHRQLEQTTEKLRTTVLEKEEFIRDLQQAKDDLDEIRTMLSDTRAKAKGNLYKKKA